ncbi:MAG TPA: DNA gyrase inhibitor YacG [Desulfomonilia bacterium]|nr:DNA gyrase inhibitor YacG [Desulfomonilia bacterium]
MDSPMSNGKNRKLVIRVVQCPTCKKKVPFEGNPYRPFCSRGCKGLDLIHWASESYNIEGKPDKDDHNDKPN